MFVLRSTAASRFKSLADNIVTKQNVEEFGANRQTNRRLVLDGDILQPQRVPWAALCRSCDWLLNAGTGFFDVSGDTKFSRQIICFTPLKDCYCFDYSSSWTLHMIQCHSCSCKKKDQTGKRANFPFSRLIVKNKNTHDFSSKWTHAKSRAKFVGSCARIVSWKLM